MDLINQLKERALWNGTKKEDMIQLCADYSRFALDPKG
jgi:hypothetical protein